ncbi:DegT/DnrJ/EryC1/StrS family aminotransferase [Accumulibacter sp.]|uniref:DegT/DnrJ/EryC1/StrS family aminotransferase n=1 Tax=Accumulibacter sp. TaxID=2053492 RepID=UPI002632282C|nr:DegT/DnrJ/EryC1/StrS family aminotransferase [Accumulibacter sp.]
MFANTKHLADTRPSCAANGYRRPTGARPQADLEALKMNPAGNPNPPLPRTPVLDWSSFSPIDQAPDLPCIDDVGYSAVTTSGRAAIYQALRQLRLTPGSAVLVPTYHCPTMIAPVVLANLEPAYFPIRSDGLPNLNSIDSAAARRAKAMIVSHYFGFGRSLAEVREWCDERRIALIEDCAHSYFGYAGERPVGTWGDYSTASLSKFFPIPEGGVLASARRPIPDLGLSPQGLKRQLKDWANVLESAIAHERLAGINRALACLFRLKGRFGQVKPESDRSVDPSATSMMRVCDMGRISHAPTTAARALKAILPRGQIITRRRRNFALYARHLGQVPGARPLFPHAAAEAVPYVFPLWVDDADRVYRALRERQFPVFRWDRIWPDMPPVRDDLGPSWSHHVLQLLCHQDLSEEDITRTSLATIELLSEF